MIESKSSSPCGQRKFTHMFLLLGVLMVTAVFSSLTVHSVHSGSSINCNNNNWPASNQTELNDAIACFNNKTNAGDYTISVTQNISLTTSSSPIHNPIPNVALRVEGNEFAIDGQAIEGVQLFRVNDNTNVTMNNITLTRGRGIGSSGGIRNDGALTITNSTLSDNSANSLGGALLNYGSGTITIHNALISGNSSANGGAINNQGGAITITASTFSNNSSAVGGAILTYRSMTIANSTFSGNSATYGGGIFTGGAMVIVSNSTFSNNSATISGGGIYKSGNRFVINNSIVANSRDGGDCSGVITSEGYNLAGDNSCNFNNTGDINNTDPLLEPLADNGGHSWTHALAFNSPAIDAGNSDLTNDQRGFPRPQGAADDIGAMEMATYDCNIMPWAVADEAELYGAIRCYNATTLAQSYVISLTQNISLTISMPTINNNRLGTTLSLEGNSFAVDGQEIEGIRPFNIARNTTATFNNMTVTRGNGTDWGGGILNSGTLTVSNSTIANNTSSLGGGGIYNPSTLTLNNSTISGNTSNFNGAGGGGGISNWGTLVVNSSTFSANLAPDGGGAAIRNKNNGTLLISNSTISGNSANWGGGLLNDDISTATISNSTFSANAANNLGGGMYNEGTINIDNSIIANSSSGNECFNDSGVINDNGHNIVEDNSCNFLGGQDPMLAPLANNGGSTQTHALLTDSPAIDAGDSELTSDQRGFARPQGSADDIGAFEAAPTVYHTYLPHIINHIASAPDLIVLNINVTSDDVQVVVKNQGNAPVNDNFWVDVYINPDIPPTGVNQTWVTQGGEGIVWGVTGTILLPEETLTLTLNSPFFDLSESYFSGSVAADAAVYAQVDEVNLNTTYGNVLESHEIKGQPYNNILQATTNRAMTLLSTGDVDHTPPSAKLPQR